MSNFKYVADDAIIVPALGIHLTTGQVVDVPTEFEDQFSADARFENSQRKTADVSPDPSIVNALTAPVPVVAPAAPEQIPA